jgi:integrase
VDLEREKVCSTGDIECWSTTEAEVLLCGCPAVALPALAIELFAGLRTAEVARLRWEDVDFKQRHVAVLAGDAKTAGLRLVPMTNNLVEWLAPRRGGPKALVYPENAATISKRITEAVVGPRFGPRRLVKSYRMYRVGRETTV